MEIEYISLPKIKGEICRADLTGIKYFCVACLDPQCRSINCTRCKLAMTMTDLTPFHANCRFDYTSGRTSTTG